MTATLQVQLDPVRLAAQLATEKALRAEAEHEVNDLRAGLYAVVDQLVERKLIQRRNYGFHPPSESELADIAFDTHAYWLGVAQSAAAPAAGVAE